MAQSPEEKLRAILKQCEWDYRDYRPAKTNPWLPSEPTKKRIITNDTEWEIKNLNRIVERQAEIISSLEAQIKELRSLVEVLVNYP